MDEKKEKIMQAALQVFSFEGYHKAKISKIAEIAGIGAGTVYLYFKNKEAILEELFINSWSRIDEKLVKLDEIKNMTPEQKIREIIGEIIEMVAQNSDLARLILSEYSFWSAGPSTKVNDYVGSVMERTTKIISKGIECGEFNKSLNAKDATVFLVGGIWHLMAAKTIDFTNVDVLSMTKEIEHLAVNGLK